MAATSVAEPSQEGSAKPTGAAAAPATSHASDLVPSNPLWALPLTKLTATRERPLFSPSRRPPPPVEVAKAAPPPPPPPPPEPEKLQLSLVGTVVNADGEGFGLFLNPAGPIAPLRLKTGDAYKGWVLRAVRQREVEFNKEQQVSVLKLPAREKKPARPATEDNSGPRPVAAPAATSLTAPADRGTEVANQTTPQATSPDTQVANVRKSGFRRPGSSEGETPPPIGDVVIQQPAMLLAPPSPPQVNPFGRGSH